MIKNFKWGHHSYFKDKKLLKINMGPYGAKT
jgi:hypothetical protein